MSSLLGVLLGAGLFLIWWSTWADDAPRAARTRRTGLLRKTLVRAGLGRVSPAALAGACCATGVLSGLLVTAVSGAAAFGLYAGLLGGWLPLAAVRHRARSRTAVMREVWPDVVDHLRSAIRAGLSLPEALVRLQYRGPSPSGRPSSSSPPTTARRDSSRPH